MKFMAIFLAIVATSSAVMLMAPPLVSVPMGFAVAALMIKRFG